jgi:hypothetical protein
MTIKYALTRAEIVRVFFVGMGTSSRILSVVLLFSLLPALVSIRTTVALTGTVRAANALVAFAWLMSMFCLLVAMVFVRGKTGERTLSVNEEGLSTEIGSIKAQLPWKKIKDVRDAGRYILIVGLTGNAFFIPFRAFDGSDQRNQFLSEIDRWRNIA